ncbi:hypothetical protein [Clostridium uliginosum]|uniref:Uncharacterized protein n=1 Tax=Clostridium uliginosum TaxID=119641 RepID=A0A1I1GVE9_9CLOT|nr:hypothetical protein [Clostridium uliginosum]SFC15446.1 hypothetical protein SAMN05421842_10171 [Clostridium uliginosum]
MGNNKIVTKNKIGNREVTITITCNKPSKEALKNLADGILYLYSKNSNEEAIANG